MGNYFGYYWVWFVCLYLDREEVRREIMLIWSFVNSDMLGVKLGYRRVWGVKFRWKFVRWLMFCEKKF